MSLLKLDAAWKVWRPAALTIDETKEAALAAMGIPAQGQQGPATGEIKIAWEVKR